MKVVVPQLWDYDKHGPGNVVEWFKREGEETGENDLLCQIMVVKAINNVYSGKSGIVSKILAPIGTEVKPGDDLAEIVESTTTVESGVGKAEKPSVKHVVERILATPSARRMAREKGIDLSILRGTGKEGIVTGEDVLLASRTERKEEAYAVKQITGLRKAISETMMKSISGSAQLTLHTAADVTELVALKKSWPGDRSISYNDLICHFTVKALQDHKYMNSHIIDNREIREFRDIHLGISVQTEEGLFSVVVRNAEKLSLDELKTNIGNLAGKARSGTLSIDEVTGSTFTVSNLGMVKINHFTPIINPPEIAILGVGGIGDKLELSPNGIELRKVIHLSLTIDHRAIDGYTASLFLNRLMEILGSPREFL